MSELVSANWNSTYGINNPKNVINKNSHFGILPINQHYVFFKNGGTSLIQNNQNISAEVKNVLENERRLRGRNLHGEGTERPCGFTEIQMNDLYYNSYGLNFNVNSIGMPIDPLTVVLALGGQTSLFGLLSTIGIASALQNVALELFFSSTSFMLPKIGYTDYYTYETKNQLDEKGKILPKIIKRNHPYVDNKKIQKDQLINLSSESAFRKIIGNSSYDTMLSKYQLNGGCGFFSSPFKGNSKNTLQSYVNNLMSNSNIKYQQLNKLNQKYNSSNNFIENSKIKEESILNDTKNKIGGILSPISIYIDFSDYKTVLFGSKQKGYPNPQKEKSIFGPYICRSKKTFMYYPKIIISHPKYSTLSTFSNGMVWSGGINIFGAYPTIYSTGFTDNSEAFSILIRMASYGLPPIINGICNFIDKDKAFNLGAGYSENITSYESKSIVAC